MQVGAAIVASRYAVAEVPPLTLAMLRYAIGFCCLLPFAFGVLPDAARDHRPPVSKSRARDLLAMAAPIFEERGELRRPWQPRLWRWAQQQRSARQMVLIERQPAAWR